MIRFSLVWLVLLFAILPLAGCGSASTPSTSETATAASGDETDSATEPAAAGDVKLAILSFDEIERQLADKRGKVVVMDAWSTSCPPCMKDFHNLVELHSEYPAEELACVSLSFDYEGLGQPEEASEPVLQFLRSQRATFDNWMSNEESDVLYRKFDLNSVPAIFVYDRSGKLRQRFENEGAYADVRKLVAELVKESPDSAAEQPDAEKDAPEKRAQKDGPDDSQSSSIDQPDADEASVN